MTVRELIDLLTEGESLEIGRDTENRIRLTARVARPLGVQVCCSHLVSLDRADRANADLLGGNIHAVIDAARDGGV